MNRVRLGGLLPLLAAAAFAPILPLRAQTTDAAPPAAAADSIPVAPRNWWHLDAAAERYRGVSTDRAYRELLQGRTPARTVVVAIIDSGVDVTHEDLDDNLWVNPGEVPGNRKDDDGNGYVDDVHGWNFIGGPDGRNVVHDTYELTRVFAELRDRYAGARADTLSASGRAELARLDTLRGELESRQKETRESLQQVLMIEAGVERMFSLLQRHLRTDSLTPEAVSAIQPTSPELVQAKSVYAQLTAAGITREAIQREKERLRTGAEYGLNPAFDPRHIVGDDPTDLDQRHYGNPDVVGPDAEHGTHVAGIVAAERGNGIGIDGIAPAVRIMAIRAVPDGDERDKDVANAIRYAVDNGAHIVNMSFGKGYSPQREAVIAAVRHAEEKGVLLVHAAGNDGANLDEKPSYPAPDDGRGARPSNWLEVGASSWQLAADSLPAPFSNYSRTRVDLFAPGVAIYSTVPGQGYAPNSGTSMAAPVVSGVAALVMAYHPTLTAPQVRAILMETATRYPELTVARPGVEGERIRFADLSATGGVVNAHAALKRAAELSRPAR